MKNLFGDNLVDEAIATLREYEPANGYYLAFSGGKDSIVLMALAEMAGVQFDAHYSVTTIDPPELVHFIRDHYPQVSFDRPEKPFLTRLVEKGFPLRWRRWCCHEYKESGGHKRVVLTGVRRAESVRRRSRKLVEACYRDLTRTYVNPIIDWQDADVWRFIRGHRLRYCTLYDEGFRRIGCILCPMNDRRWEEAQRWPGYIRAFRRAFNRLYERIKDRPSASRWRNGDEMFRWWVSPSAEVPRKPVEGQTVMFE